MKERKKRTAGARCAADLTAGETGTVAELDLPKEALVRRLRELGVTEGCDVTCVGISPLGDPIAYRVRGSVLAIRKTDAEGIWMAGGGKTWR